MSLEIPKELKRKELTAFLVEKLDELSDNLCQDEDQLIEFIKKWNNGGYPICWPIGEFKSGLTSTNPYWVQTLAYNT